MKFKVTTLQDKKTFADKTEKTSGNLPVVGEMSFSNRSRVKKLKIGRVRQRFNKK